MKYNHQVNMIPDEDALNLLAISGIQGLGYFTIREIYSRYPQFKNFWEVEKNELHNILRISKNKSDYNKIYSQIKEGRKFLIDQAYEQYHNMSNKNIVLLTNNNSEFPERLKRIPNPPYWLFVQGNNSLLNNLKYATVVGTRKPTNYGIILTEKLTKLLVELNFIIISGLAEGIDTAAHKTTIENNGKTIAILGHGIYDTLPKGNVALRNEILEKGGSIITEYFLNDRYSRLNFIRRNRLQSGLSHCVFPIQAGYRSGTRHTLEFAYKQKRVVIGVKSEEFDGHNVEQNQVLKLLKENQDEIFTLYRDKKKLYNYLIDTCNGLSNLKQLELDI